MSKKNLDTLFQGKFKDFKEKPDEKVWASIEATLDKKEKSRKPVPLWWKLGGAAAVLAILIYVVNPLGDSTPEQDVIITDIENVDGQDVEQGEDIKEKDSSIPQSSVETEVVDVDTIDKKENIDPILQTEDNSPAIADTRKDTQSYPLDNTRNTEENSLVPEKSPLGEAIQIVDSQKDGAPNEAATDNSLPNPGLVPKNENEAVAVSDAGLESGKKDETKLIPDTETDYTKISSKDNPRHASEEAITETGEKTSKEIEQANGGKSIFDEIQEQQEEEALAEVKGSRWSAGPSIAPVYYNAIGEGSPVHSIFVPNSKSGEINLSYGLTVAYEISDRLSIRSGLHRVDYGYDTNDVEFSSSLQASADGQIDNINYTATSKTLVVQSKANGISSAVADPEAALIDLTAQDPSRNGTMAQQFGYLEVPVELNYALLDRKFGINLIGGVSSLFLVDNTVTLNADGLTTEMGEANNINNVNFSTNVGFGLNYRFTPKIRFNLEPIFKYQLNTFSETAGNFQPFSVGVYSGLSFRF
ncbi:outer membrane beta-barrel protein [Ulvibacterium sp.]|uniref:outer membrane beta-barrel protein n=1 Tax=Ulvibacterium sp. TaxID=2665914 RepID=UPI00262241A5|nr:outer membrane beta-barrel protein [Ulvibacterium sp.]